MFLTVRNSLIVLSSLYCSFSKLATAIRRARKIHADMNASFVNDLIQLVAPLPVLMPAVLLLACVGLGFFITRLKRRDTWDDGDEASVARKRDMTILACVGVDLFIIAYVGVVFFLFRFLVDHVDLLR